MSEGYNIGPQVQAALEKSGLSHAKVAADAGMSWAQLYKIIKGQRLHVSADTIRRLARVLRCTSDYLLGLEESPWSAAAPCQDARPATRRTTRDGHA